MYIHVDTIEQYKVLQYIKQHFFIDKIAITKINQTSLCVTDYTNECLIFEYFNGTIITHETKNRGF